MKQPRIVFVTAEGKPHTLRLDQLESLAALPATERDQLIALLEAIKAAPLEKARATPGDTMSPATTPGFRPSTAPLAPKPERLGKGDVDARVSQLMAQERHRHQPQVTVQTMYKWVAVAAAIGIILILVL